MAVKKTIYKVKLIEWMMVTSLKLDLTPVSGYHRADVILTGLGLK